MPIAKFKCKIAKLNHNYWNLGAWKVREKCVKSPWNDSEKPVNNIEKLGPPRTSFFDKKNDLKTSQKIDLWRIFFGSQWHHWIMEAIKRAKEREARARQAIDQAGKTKKQPVPQFRHNKFTPNPCSHFFWGLLAMKLPLLRIQALALLGISSWSWDQTSVA